MPVPHDVPLFESMRLASCEFSPQQSRDLEFWGSVRMSRGSRVIEAGEGVLCFGMDPSEETILAFFDNARP